MSATDQRIMYQSPGYLAVCPANAKHTNDVCFTFELKDVTLIPFYPDVEFVVRFANAGCRFYVPCPICARHVELVLNSFSDKAYETLLIMYQTSAERIQKEKELKRLREEVYTLRCDLDQFKNQDSET